MALLEILASVVFISLLSFVGVISLSLGRDVLNRILTLLIAFASGSMLAAAFLDLIPEAAGELGVECLSVVLAGILAFFVLEKFVHWHHCGKEECHVKPVGYLSLVGDGFHNFLDGVVIAAAYISDFSLGLVTTIAIALHEIPQEFGDFAVLLHAGFKARKALFYNFLSATASVFGGLAGFYFLSQVSSLVPVMVALAAGGFIYMATADLIPELHKETKRLRMIEKTLALFAGIFLVYLAVSFLHV